MKNYNIGIKAFLLFFNIFIFTFSFLLGQYDLRQQKSMETSNNPRRIPIPPRDRSKDQILVLRGGTLIDGTGSEPLHNAIIIIQGNKIIEVGTINNVTIPNKIDQILDTNGLYIMPGLIDVHMHFTAQRGEDFAQYRDSDAAIAIRGVERLGLYLDGGITTVRDTGTQNDIPIRLREAVERRIFSGPRIFWCGKLIASRGGHGDGIVSAASGNPKSIETEPDVRVATGPWDYRLAVREQIRMGADFIKLTAPISRDELAAAIDEAHMLGFRITIDAFGNYITWAVESGIDCIEHPLSVPNDAIELMSKKGTFWIPTLVAYNVMYYDGFPKYGVPPGGYFFTMSRRFYWNPDEMADEVRKGERAGIRIGIGTDIFFDCEKRYPKDYFKEMELLEKAGFKEEEILASATKIGSEILNMEDKLGTLEKGKLADVLVIEGNPLVNIKNIQNLRLVIADGQVVRNKLKER